MMMLLLLLMMMMMRRRRRRRIMMKMMIQTSFIETLVKHKTQKNMLNNKGAEEFYLGICL